MSDLPFKPLQLSDKNLVEEYRRRYPVEISEFTFTNLYVWREARPVFLAENKGCLFVLRLSPDGRAWLLPPLGECNLNDGIRRLFDLGLEGKTIAGIDRVPEATAETLRQVGLSVTYDRDNSDYVYRREDLAELRGRKYSKKRNHVKDVLARYVCRYEEISDPLIEKCLAFQHRWCEMKQCGRVPGLCEEYKAIVETFERFRELGVFGAAILVEDEIRAFTVGEELLPGTAVVHFEKGDPSIDGLSQLINQWFCQKSLSAFEYVNREQDLGIPGLRQAKESYYPHHMVNKYKATLPTETYAPCSKSMG